jgi:hypothetical protein
MNTIMYRTVKMWTDDGSSVQLVMHYIQSALQTNKQTKNRTGVVAVKPLQCIKLSRGQFSICLSFRDLSSLR